MRVIALRPFPFSRDGTTIEEAPDGAEVDIPDAMVPGLTAEGWIAAIPAPPEEPAIEPAAEEPTASRTPKEFAIAPVAAQPPRAHSGRGKSKRGARH
jgi:hypothetical protein